MTRILIADNHPLFRLALAQAVRSLDHQVELIEADRVESARQHLLAQSDIDLVLLDLHMPGSHGLMALVALRAEFPAVAIVMICAHDDPAVIRRALTCGAAGFIPKRSSLGELQESLRTVLACEYPSTDALLDDRERKDNAEDIELAARLASLSPQQLRAPGLVAEGLLNKQIADRLDMQERTVKAHMSAVFERLGVRNRTQASMLLRSLE
ncbi:MAG: response regulator transcription factor, partial [Dokdonella sp.]